jgi:hypothetical protein
VAATAAAIAAASDADAARWLLLKMQQVAADCRLPAAADDLRRCWLAAADD